MNRKMFYEAPETELIVVRFEGNFCETGNSNGTEDGTVTSPFDDWDD